MSKMLLNFSIFKVGFFLTVCFVAIHHRLISKIPRKFFSVCLFDVFVENQGIGTSYFVTLLMSLNRPIILSLTFGSTAKLTQSTAPGAFSEGQVTSPRLFSCFPSSFALFLLSTSFSYHSKYHLYKDDS